MGNRSSKSKERHRTIQNLKASTYFTQRELEKWYKGFMKEYPTGKLGKEQFNDICKHFFPYGDATKFSSFFFFLFDQNQDGTIEFEEFINALSITSRGTLDEKICWTFRMYDQDKDGYVTKLEMLNIVDSIYQMVEPVSNFPVEENTPQKRVDRIFSVMDKNDDEVLSLEEFVEGCKADGKILRALSSYDDLT